MLGLWRTEKGRMREEIEDLMGCLDGVFDSKEVMVLGGVGVGWEKAIRNCKYGRSLATAGT